MNNNHSTRKTVAVPERQPENADYSVFYKHGDEANDSYLTKEQAMSLAHELESKGYETIVARLLPNNEWKVVHQTH